MKTLLIMDIPGSQDFIQYWSAFQLALKGGNPYDAHELFSLQNSIDQNLTFPILMWNPPWIMLLLSPILMLSFESARILWLICNTLFFFGSVFLFSEILQKYSLLKPNRSLRYMLFSSVIFYPCIDCIGSGQLGNLLLFISVLTIYLYLRQNYVLAAVFSSLLTIKPHLFIVIGFFLLIKLFSHQKRILIVYFLAALATQILASEIIFSASLRHWITALFYPASDNVYPNLLNWRFETIPGVIRGVIFDITNRNYSAIMTIIPITTLVIVQYFSNRISTLTHYTSLLAASIALAPYGWFSDFALLLPLYMLTIHLTISTNKRLLALYIIVAQLLLIVLSSWKFPIHQFAILTYLPMFFSLYIEKRSLLLANQKDT